MPRSDVRWHRFPDAKIFSQTTKDQKCFTSTFNCKAGVHRSLTALHLPVSCLSPQSEASHGKHKKEVDPWGEQLGWEHLNAQLESFKMFQVSAAQTLPGIFRRGKDNEIQMPTRMDRIGIIGCILKAHSVTGLSRVKSEVEYEIWYEARLPIFRWAGDTAWRTEKDWQSQVGVSGTCYAAIYALHISFAY